MARAEPKADKAYQRRYYSENAEELAQRRREKYAADADVRAMNRARSKAWRESRKEGTPVTREIFRQISGRRTRVYSVGQIADAADYGVSTIRLMIQNGDLPEPKHPTGTHRYYTLGEFNSIVKTLQKRR